MNRKNITFLTAAVSLLIILMATFSSCSKNEDDSPYITSADAGKTIVAWGKDWTGWSTTLKTNIDFSKLKATCGASWCSLNLKDMGNGNCQLTVSAEDNPLLSNRQVTIHVNATNASASVSFILKQDKATDYESIMKMREKQLGFDCDGGSRTLIADESLHAECDADWVKLERNGYYLTVRTSSTTTDRTARVTFKDRESPSITITQTTYKAGDSYSVDGVTGTVGYIGDGKRFIFKKVGEDLQYRKYDDAGQEGATSMDNGLANTNAVRQIIRNKGKSYPAFEAIDNLNTGGVTGWYLPAINELDKMKSFISGDTWSSTEAYVLLAYYHTGKSSKTGNKANMKLLVYAIRQF